MRKLATLLLALALVGCAASMVAAADWDVSRDFSMTTNPSGQWTYGVYLSDGHPIGNVYVWPNGNHQYWAEGSPLLYWGEPGQYVESPAVHYVDSDVASVGLNPTQFWAPRQVMLHPSPTYGYLYGGFIRWTAPSDMTVAVDALFFGCDETTTDVHVLLNGDMQNGPEGGAPVWVGSLFDGVIRGNYGYAPLGIAATGMSNHAAYSAALNLKAGDNLDFAISYGGAAGGANLSDLTGLNLTITEVPEPGGLAALGSCLVGFAGFAVRRRKG